LKENGIRDGLGEILTWVQHNMQNGLVGGQMGNVCVISCFWVQRW